MKREKLSREWFLFLFRWCDATIKNHLLFVQRVSERKRKKGRQKLVLSWHSNRRITNNQFQFNEVYFFSCHFYRISVFVYQSPLTGLNWPALSLLFLLFCHLFFSPLSICRSNNNSIKLFVIANRPLPIQSQAKPSQTKQRRVNHL